MPNNNNELQKDFEGFNRDLNSILIQITNKNKLLGEINELIAGAKLELKKIQDLKNPLIDSLEEKINERKDELKKLEIEIVNKKLNYGDIVDAHNKVIEDKKNHIEKLDSLAMEKENILPQFEAEENTYRVNIEIAKSELKTINEMVNAKQQELALIGNLQERRDEIISEIKNLENNKSRLLQRETDAANFYHQNEVWQKNLEAREGECLVMEERLTPEYLKVFGNAANIGVKPKTKKKK